eukprot:TRINITY_DN45627_c0_g2_i1.p1 TRINITY_DN45627_c0_g2~~TRINITY_DN45627_c0_g2_i1.p1  ORF type:complete len:349 (-),score=94.41 TRINITY_DN45627_c0_g2_i1:242-1288(-)
MMHSGHFNALRQARKLGDVLVAGVHSDDEITRAKGMPVLNNEERLALVNACKWVDEVAFGTPYNPTVDLLDELNCDFVAHGDDIGPTYKEVQEAGRLQVIKRTEGVSTTDIVGRLLLMTKDHHAEKEQKSPNGQRAFHRCPSVDVIQDAGQKPFMPTTMRISQFANNKSPKEGDTVVYIDGAFDLYHPGHVKLLEAAKAMGDFLYVGLHHDADINELQGANYPVCTLHERALCVLSCKFVDEVVFGTPLEVTSDLISLLNVDIVVDSTELKLMQYATPEELDSHRQRFFKVPIDMGLFRPLDSHGEGSSTQNIITRIVDNRLNYMRKYEKKAAAEKEYQASHVHVAEQ